MRKTKYEWKKKPKKPSSITKWLYSHANTLDSLTHKERRNKNQKKDATQILFAEPANAIDYD